MNILKDNIWNYHNRGYIVITTNGNIKSNNECVMGRGIAKQASNKFPELAKRLGKVIREEGNRVFIWKKERLITFPTKYNWWEKADLYLIKQSSLQLKYICSQNRMDLNISQNYIFMPKPGCSNGGLNWTDVSPIIEKYLPEVNIVDFN